MAQLDFISNQVICDVNGVPIPGAKVFYYLTGTTTLQNTYSDAGLTTPNTNPVITDANGVVPDVYLAATRYKRVAQNASSVSLPQYDVDPLDATQSYIALAALPSPAYALLRVANTTDGHTYRRNLANNAWIDEGLTDSLLNAATVTDQLTGTSTAVASTPDSVAALWQRGTDIASAATLSLPATGGGVFNITGTTNFGAISSAQGGRTIKVRFAGILTITHNATSMILPGAANITTAAGDVAMFVNEAAADASGSNWRCFFYQRASGAQVVFTAASQAEMEAASSLLVPVVPGRVQNHPGVAKFFLKATGNSTTIEASHNITSVADTAVGRMTVTIATDFSGVDWALVLTTESTGAAALEAAMLSNATQAAGTFEMACRNNGGGLLDPDTWHAVGFGDQ